MTFTKLLIDNLDKYLIAWDTECPFKCTQPQMWEQNPFSNEIAHIHTFIWSDSWPSFQPQRLQEDIPYHFKKGMVCQYGMVCPPATSEAGNSVATFSTNFDCNFMISWRIRKYLNWLQNRYRKCLQNVTLMKLIFFIEFIEFIEKLRTFFSKNSIKIFFDKFDKFFEKWTL
jgi:hypothetical protein